MRTERPAPRTFAQQIATTVAVSIIIALMVSSLATAWVVSAWVRGSILSNVERIVAEFAKRSVVVYLLADESVAKNAASVIRAIPVVSSVVFLRPNGRPLFRDEALPGSVIGHLDLTMSDGRCWEEPRVLQCIAPVTTEPSKSPFDPIAPGYEPISEVVGYVYVSIDTSVLVTLTKALVAANVLIGVVFGGLLVTWLQLRVRHLTEPLSNLSARMMRAGQGEAGVRAEIRGPAEARGIARVFNRMIERVEHQQMLLEAEVADRTAELQQARDAALHLSRLKSDLLSMLTHEIRTPLTAIKGHTEIALRDLRFIDDTEDIGDRLKLVLGTGLETLELIDHILSYARLEAGKTEVNVGRIQLAELVHGVAASLQPMALKNDNKLSVQVEGDPIVESDPTLLLAILHNLVTNACKYTKDGEIMLNVGHDAKTVSICITDNGIGIPIDQHERVFEPFNQVNRPDFRSCDGVGLGLAISKRFCEILGGIIQVDSEEGIGSTFRVRIPISVNPDKG